MNLFKYSAKKNSSKLNKTLFPIILFIIVCMSIGTYAYIIGEKLAPFNLTYIMVSMFVMIVTIMTFIEGIYKSQGILFESKDNDLLFSLPIKKKTILLSRISSILIYNFILGLFIIAPGLYVYIINIALTPKIVIIITLLTLFSSIIPTILASLFGYLIALITSKSKKKNIVA